MLKDKVQNENEINNRSILLKLNAKITKYCDSESQEFTTYKGQLQIYDDRMEFYLNNYDDPSLVNFDYKLLRIQWAKIEQIDYKNQLNIIKQPEINQRGMNLCNGFNLYYLEKLEEDFYLKDKNNQSSVSLESGCKSFISAVSIFQLRIDYEPSHQQIQNVEQPLNILIYRVELESPQILYQFYETVRSKIIMKDLHFNFRAVKKLGKGNFASVYLVKNREKKSKEYYAVKCFQKKQMSEQADGFISYYNEIMILQNLDHPHIIKQYEVWESINSYYNILEYCKCGNLLDLIIQNKQFRMNLINKVDLTLNDYEIQQIMTQILSALCYLDKRNILHRDIKPENILLRKKDQIDIVLSDFGLSLQLNPLLDYFPYPKCGTPGYVAPEILNIKKNQLKTARYDQKCDIFSSGITLDFLFAANSESDVVEYNKNCTFDKNSSKLKKIHPLCKDLLFKMLEPDPLKRISAQDAFNHPYIQNKDLFDQEDELVPLDSPANININKERQNHVFSFKVKKPKGFSNLKNDKLQLNNNQQNDYQNEFIEEYELVRQSSASQKVYSQGNLFRNPSIEDFIENNIQDFQELFPQSIKKINSVQQEQQDKSNISDDILELLAPCQSPFDKKKIQKDNFFF